MSAYIYRDFILSTYGVCTR